MTSTATATPIDGRARTLAIVAALVLIPFTVFTLDVVASHGLLGFLTLAGDEPWALQVLLDLGIAGSFAIGWMVKDARRRGLTVWPFVVATVTCGSIGLLSYVIRRGVGRGPVTAAGAGSDTARGRGDRRS